MALRWCAARMVEAGKQFRRVNGHLHLCSLRDTLLKRVALVSPTVDPRVRTAPRLFPAGWRRASRACAAVTPGNRARTVADHPPGAGFAGRISSGRCGGYRRALVDGAWTWVTLGPVKDHEERTWVGGLRVAGRGRAG